MPNSETIQTNLGPGDYTLWLFEYTGKSFSTLSHCKPISLHVVGSQINSEENFASCDVLPLPSSLNFPGLLDDAGYLHFRREVFLNLSQTSNTITVIRF